MEKQTWIHIGFPKCASTSLQQDFFAKSDKISYLGRSDDCHGLRESHHHLLMALATLDDAQYQLRRMSIEQQIKNFFTAENGMIEVVSDELLVSAYRPYLSGIPVADSYLVAQRLKSIFPNAKILMVIRNQIKFLSSMMGQLMRNNGVIYNMEDFFSAHKGYAENGCGSFFHLADYNRIYQIYTGLFGAENIEVVCLEELAKNPEKVIDYLLRRMGLNGIVNREDVLPGKKNTRTSSVDLLRIRCGRLRNIYKLVPRDVRQKALNAFSKFGPKSDVTMNFSQEDLLFLESFYGVGNRSLQKATGINLVGFDYPIGSEDNER